MTTTTEPLSYWQRGCNDAKAGRPRVVPFSTDRTQEQRLGNEGYLNGYRFGQSVRYQPVHNEGSEP